MTDHIAIRQLGKYEILSELGKGGFATVYLARDTVLGREVALKVLDPLVLRGPELGSPFPAPGRSHGWPETCSHCDHQGDARCELTILCMYDVWW